MTVKDQQYYSPKTIAKLLDIDRKSVWRFVDKGWLPKPLKVSERIRRWHESDVQNLIAIIESQ